uniref:VIP36-like protein n=2 Tax=Callorhinchus milii TaxID=7868 RepID=V9L2P7_CALMI|eukprot:gi/632988999/ref/XP_007883410.1/ PREDICTED: VIP36-like protein [Callorhinchus milii]
MALAKAALRGLGLGSGPRALLRLLSLLLAVQGDRGTEEYLKREYSLTKPYQGLGASSSGSHWELLGNAMVTTQFVRLTPDLQSRQGAIWNRIPCALRDWELQVHFKIHGQGKKNLNGDGLGIWYTRDRMQAGPVFGSADQFSGLGVFVDTYPNEEKQHESKKRRYSPTTQRIFPYLSAMVGNGSISYDHTRDGRPNEIGGCSAHVRNLNHDTFIVIRYLRRRLTVMIDIDGKNEWRDCIDVPGVRLPLRYYFGASSATGDLTDNHDIVSLKLYQLMEEGEHLPGEGDGEEEEVLTPSVDNFDPHEDALPEPMSGLALFAVMLMCLVGAVIAVVIGIISYQKWQEQSRKRFY